MNTGKRELLERRGFQSLHTVLRFKIDLANRSPEPVDPPDGHRAAPVRPGRRRRGARDDERGVRGSPPLHAAPARRVARPPPAPPGVRPAALAGRGVRRRGRRRDARLRRGGDRVPQQRRGAAGLAGQGRGPGARRRRVRGAAGAGPDAGPRLGRCRRRPGRDPPLRGGRDAGPRAPRLVRQDPRRAHEAAASGARENRCCWCCGCYGARVATTKSRRRPRPRALLAPGRQGAAPRRSR